MFFSPKEAKDSKYYQTSLIQEGIPTLVNYNFTGKTGSCVIRHRWVVQPINTLKQIKSHWGSQTGFVCLFLCFICFCQGRQHLPDVHAKTFPVSNRPTRTDIQQQSAVLSDWVRLGWVEEEEKETLKFFFNFFLFFRGNKMRGGSLNGAQIPFDLE